MKIAIIGCGNMGMAFARSFVAKELVALSDFILIEKIAERAELLKNDFEGAVLFDQISSAIQKADLIILSVKPQDFSSVAASLKPFMMANQVVLSIMAGIAIERISGELGHHKVVRAMPNTPAMLGMGITAYAASEAVESQELEKVGELIGSTGKSVALESESMLDAVTAVSGSGPAYFFYIMKSMIDAGKNLGFDDETAALLVKQTMLGSYHLAVTSDKTLEELIQAVASKGGTTEAALNSFNVEGLNTVLANGINAAEKRSKELAKGV